MVEFTYRIRDRQGLHVRPVTRLAVAAEKFVCRTTVFCNEKQADVRSLMSMLALEAQYGMTVTFQMEGEDEEKAAQVFRALLDEMSENSRQ